MVKQISLIRRCNLKVEGVLWSFRCKQKKCLSWPREAKMIVSDQIKTTFFRVHGSFGADDDDKLLYFRVIYSVRCSPKQRLKMIFFTTRGPENCETSGYSKSHTRGVPIPCQRQWKWTRVLRFCCCQILCGSGYWGSFPNFIVGCVSASSIIRFTIPQVR